MARGQDVKDAMTTLARATAAAHDEIQAGRQAIVAKREELAAVRQAPLPLKEAEARVPAAIQAAGEAWLAEKGEHLLGVGMPADIAMRAGEWHPTSHALGEASDVGPTVLPFLNSRTPGPPALPFGCLAAGDPEAAGRMLVGLLRAQYRAVPPGLPLAERPARVAELEAEIAHLEVADEERTDAAIAAGLAAVTLRSDVETRRQADADRTQREAQLDAERAARLRAIDEEHAQAVKVS